MLALNHCLYEIYLGKSMRHFRAALIPKNIERFRQINAVY